MRTRIAGASLLLAFGFLGAPQIFTSLPPAPNAYVTDNARFLPDEAQTRLAAKLKLFKETHPFVRLYVYTLRSANGSPSGATQELYRRWKMRDREIYDGLATVFVFRDEKKALVMLGQGAPASTEEALDDLAPDLEAVFGPEPEGAISRVIDRIGESLSRADSTSWLDSPPVPAGPGGPVYGNPDFTDESSTPMLEEAVRRASTAGHPIVLVLNPAKGMDSPQQRVGKLAEAWPGRIILAAFRHDFSVVLAVPDGLKDRFPEDQRDRLRSQVERAMTNSSYPRTLARAVGEIGMLAEGKTPPPWVEWKHPLETIGGGQDEDPAPLVLGVVIGLVLVFLVSFFLYMLFTNPKAVLLWIGVNLAEAVIGGLFGGGGSGRSSGGFSGGGGSFGGGGASGSW
ncbi:MAG TPA: hypothetical protein VGM13_12315 [Thermoanaerobaculia bacterium]